MNRQWFAARLSDVRRECESLLSEPLDVEQLGNLGAELHTQIQIIIDRINALDPRFGR